MVKSVGPIGMLAWILFLPSCSGTTNGTMLPADTPGGMVAVTLRALPAAGLPLGWGATGLGTRAEPGDGSLMISTALPSILPSLAGGCGAKNSIFTLSPGR